MAITPVIWNQQFNDSPSPTTVSGQSGWWTLPRQWVTRAYVSPDGCATGQWVASPTADADAPVYFCVLADDGIHLAFQDLYQEKIAGISR